MNGQVSKKLRASAGLMGLALGATGLSVAATGIAGTLLGHGFYVPAIVTIVAITPLVAATLLTGLRRRR